MSRVVEVFVPALRRLPPGESLIAFDISDHHFGVDEYDIVNQRLTSHHYWTAKGRGDTFASPHRYAWPGEYDLMARIAGLTLRERWSDWQRVPLTADSKSHVSVWEKTGTGIHCSIGDRTTIRSVGHRHGMPQRRLKSCKPPNVER